MNNIIINSNVAAAQLDRLNFASDMAANLTHEIRNPLTTVHGFLQYFKRKEEQQQRIELYELMISELDKINHIITEFLALDKNKALRLDKLNLNILLQKLLPSILSKAAAKDIHITLAMPEIPELLLDKEEIGKAILHLVYNAIEASPPQGTVVIETRVTSEHIALLVKDYGSGIETSVLEKLGTPFITDKTNRLGLGLPLCLRIAELHNASLHIDTKESGTTVGLLFNKPESVCSIP
ncbi:ATP-binding protein [Sporomusa malonica]|uniref:histidine kinase n=1 Tax=Sporomusa malonica TaxID=112901 RepID=A0A1W2C5Q0_9FIRM|nr:ATP-binding protein [Sporomusa malonica]SMC80202.1 His Kinase A (phospho-acceptor) domain-containing protein [Sporomusa malonica]